MIDFSLVLSLLKKQAKERAAELKGDLAGAATGAVLWVLLAAAFLYFFGKFARVYLAIGETEERLFELVSLSYAALVLTLAAGAVSALGKAFFSGDLALYAAMPVSSGTLFVSRLFSVYASRVVFAAPALFLLGGALSPAVPLPPAFWGMTALNGLLLPLVSVALAGLLAPLGNALLLFFKPRFFLTFLVVTVLAAAGFFGYSRVLAAVKELLLGDDIRYFFDERVLDAVSGAARALYPADFLAGLVLGRDIGGFFGGKAGGLKFALFLVLFAGAGLAVCRHSLLRSLRAKGVREKPLFYGAKTGMGRRSQFRALVSCEFYRVFRAPSEAFSCFSLALLLPLMVYSCMSVGSSLVKKLLGLDCAEELGLFLTLLFSALTNLFCATNISRDGKMFSSVRALPVLPRTYFFAKIFFCLMVSIPSEALSCAGLLLAGLSLKAALYVFLAGGLFSFAQICFATRCDFNRFRRYGTGKGAESAVILAGLAGALLIGGGAFALRLFLTLRLSTAAGAPFFAAGAAAVPVAGLALFYLLAGLKRKYETFGGAQ